MIYAGIGSRKTPNNVLNLFKKIGYKLAKKNYILRSGNALGADQAFELGCDMANGFKEIFYSKDATKEAIDLALKYHPNPEALKNKGKYVLGLIGRNHQIISGKNLNKDVSFVICYTPDGKASGGTGSAIKYAIDRNIKVFNIFNEKDKLELKQFLKDIK